MQPFGKVPDEDVIPVETMLRPSLCRLPQRILQDARGENPIRSNVTRFSPEQLGVLPRVRWR